MSEAIVIINKREFEQFIYELKQEGIETNLNFTVEHYPSESEYYMTKQRHEDQLNDLQIEIKKCQNVVNIQEYIKTKIKYEQLSKELGLLK